MENINMENNLQEEQQVEFSIDQSFFEDMLSLEYVRLNQIRHFVQQNQDKDTPKKEKDIRRAEVDYTKKTIKCIKDVIKAYKSEDAMRLDKTTKRLLSSMETFCRFKDKLVADGHVSYAI